MAYTAKARISGRKRVEVTIDGVITSYLQAYADYYAAAIANAAGQWINSAYAYIDISDGSIVAAFGIDTSDPEIVFDHLVISAEGSFRVKKLNPLAFSRVNVKNAEVYEWDFKVPRSLRRHERDLYERGIIAKDLALDRANQIIKEGTLESEIKYLFTKYRVLDFVLVRPQDLKLAFKSLWQFMRSEATIDIDDII